MKAKNPITLLRPILAMLPPLAAFILQWLFWPAIQPYVWFLFYPAVFFSSWIGGLRFGLIATVFSTALVWWFFIPPEYSFMMKSPKSFLSAAVFMGMGVLFSLFHGRLRKANKQTSEALAAASSAKDQLEDRVKERTAALRESEERLSSIYNTVGDILFHLAVEKDGRYRFISVNQAFVSTTGIDPGQVVGKLVNEIIPEASLTLVLEKYKEAIREKKIVRWEETSDYPTGKLTGEVSVTPVFDATGNCTHLAGAVHDITERKQAEETLRNAEVRYRAIFEQTPYGVLLVDLETGKTIEANDMAHKQLGYTREEFAAVRTSDYEALEKPEETAKHMQNIIREGSDDFETLHRTKNGEIRNVHVWAKTIRLGERVLFYAIFQDITDRKRAEETLRKSEERFSKVFHVSHTAIAIATLEGPILDVNERLLSLTGFSKEEMIGHSSFELGMISSDARERLIQQSRKEGSIRDVELEIQDKYGSTHVVLLSMHLIELDGEKRALTMFQDITDRKRAEEKMAIANEELARSNKELEQFAYVASHDLQEPLRMVSSYTQLIERRYKDKLDSDANDFIAFAVDGANRMQVLINDMLAYSRVGTHGKPFEPTNMHEVLGQAIVNLRASIEESHAIITNDELPTVSADATQIVQLFQNLIINSIKFRGNNTPFVHITSTENSDEWVFSVKDNGIGIAPEYNERIFVIFRRLHTKEYPGTGIGLAICKKIVERQGGRIWVESEQEKGSTFYFTIPKQKGKERS